MLKPHILSVLHCKIIISYRHLYSFLGEVYGVKVVISGFFGAGNTGDEAILESMIDNLREEIDPINITVFSLSPEETSRKHQVKSIYRGWRRDFLKKIQALREADLLLSGGGGLLQDTYSTKFLFGPLPYYLLIVFLAKLCGTKVMFFSQGIGPIETRWAKILMKIFANMADFITVRDEFSKDLLIKLGINKPKTVVTADIVFAFKIKQDDACYKSLPLTGKEKIIAVSVRPWFRHHQAFQVLADALDELIEKDQFTPVFVPMEGEHDRIQSEKVMGLMKNRDKCYILSTDFKPHQYLYFFRHAKIAIGMRLHFLIFAAKMGTPHIGISYDPKVKNFLERTGLWCYSFSMENLEKQRLLENFRAILMEKQNVKMKLTKSIQDLQQEAKRNIYLMKENFL